MSEPMAPSLNRHCVAVTRGARCDDASPSSMPLAMSDRCAAPEVSFAWRQVVWTDAWSTSPTINLCAMIERYNIGNKDEILMQVYNKQSTVLELTENCHECYIDALYLHQGHPYIHSYF